jgi:hypothetical protein
MDETITTATDGWYLLEPVLENGEPVSVRRTPVVAWRIGPRGAVPVALGGAPSAHAAVLSPGGTVWFRETEHASVRAFLDSLRHAGAASAARAGTSAAAGDTEADACATVRPPSRLLDPELAEEDRLHAMVELLNVHGHEFVLHAHEWHKALALAREHGWSARGTRHDAHPGWEGRYDEPHNQRVEAKDARDFAAALERALPDLPPRREEDFVQHSADRTLVSLSPAEYLGGVKGRRFVEALVGYAREGGFRIT